MKKFNTFSERTLPCFNLILYVSECPRYTFNFVFMEHTFARIPDEGGACTRRRRVNVTIYITSIRGPRYVFSFEKTLRISSTGGEKNLNANIYQIYYYIYKWTDGVLCDGKWEAWYVCI